VCVYIIIISKLNLMIKIILFRTFYSGGAWHRPQSTHAALLDKYWSKLQIGNMSREELKQASCPFYVDLHLF